MRSSVRIPFAALIFGVIVLIAVPNVFAADINYLSSTLWRQPNDIEFANGLAYVSFANGLEILDMSNPTSPTIVGRCSCQGTGGEVRIQGDYAYLADGIAGLAIINISSPQSPYLVSYYDAGGVLGNVAVAGSYAYAIVRFAVQIINIANPANPAMVGTITYPNGPGDLCISGNYLYITGPPGFEIVDISDPANPLIVYWGYIHGFYTQEAQVIGNYVYIACNEGVVIMDVSDPVHPVMAGSITTATPVHLISVSGNYAYLMGRDLYIVDITDLASPQVVSSINADESAVQGFAMEGNYVYAPSWYSRPSGGILIFDIADINNPAQVGFYETPGPVCDVAVSGDYAYVTDWNLEVVDISDPFDPRVVRTITSRNVDNPVRVAVSGDYLYFPDFDTLRIYDITEGANPVQIGLYYIGYHAFGAIFVKDSLLIMTGRLPFIDILFFNVSNPALPQLLSGMLIDGECYDITVYGDYAYLSCGRGGIKIINLADPAAPYEVNRIEDIRQAYSAITVDHYLISCDHYYSATIYDIADPVNPVVVDSFATPQESFGLYQKNNILYVSNADTLSMFSLENPAHPILRGTFDLPRMNSTYSSVIVSGSIIYVTNTLAFLLLETPYGIPGQCHYVIGDLNDNGVLNGLDVVFGVSYLKGGDPPGYDCQCTANDFWYVAGDVNNSCSFNGLDITYLVSYFKGGPAPRPCASCPPVP